VNGYLHSLWVISLELAPWLLLGLVAAGLVKAVIPMSAVGRLLGRGGLRSSVWAAVLGVPLPLCSCSVLPVAVGLRRQGASKSATASFLISTPQTGVDSLAVSWALLGPVVTIIRPVVAVISALCVGVAVQVVGTRGDATPAETGSAEQSGSCCGEKKSCCGAEPAAASCCESSGDTAAMPCCGGAGSSTAKASWLDKLWAGQRFAMTTLFGDLLKWLVIGVLVAAAVDAFVPRWFLEEWGSDPAAYALMLLVGVPMYICATSSTPLAAALLAGGVSPGAVIVFLLAGPATNVATFGVLRQELGTRATVVATAVLAVCAVGLGWASDLVITAAGWPVADQALHAEHVHGIDWFALACLLALIAIAVGVQGRLWWQRRDRGGASGSGGADHCHAPAGT